MIGYVFFPHEEDVSSDVYSKIRRYCEFERLIGVWDEFSYDNIKITTDDGWYVSIEIN